MLQSYRSSVAILDPTASSYPRVLASHVSLDRLPPKQNIILCIRCSLDRLLIIIIPYRSHLLIEKLRLSIRFIILPSLQASKLILHESLILAVLFVHIQMCFLLYSDVAVVVDGRKVGWLWGLHVVFVCFVISVCALGLIYCLVAVHLLRKRGL